MGHEQLPPKLNAAYLRDQLAEAITLLPERQKLVVALYGYEGLSFERIAEVLELTEQRVAAMWGEARRALIAAVDTSSPANFPAVAILGPEGEPLAPGSSKRTQLEASVTEISEELITALAKDPDLVYKLTPRKFEELVAELYRRRGFKVTLTPSTGDKGVDVYVVRHDELGSSLSVVQAKRYRPDRKIGLSLVRELKGTVATTNASTGVLLTTSFFTKGAKALAEEHRYTLELHDFYELQALLRLPRIL
jgi:restriction system protein